MIRLGLYWRVSNQGMLPIRALGLGQYYKFEVEPLQFIADLSSICVPIATQKIFLGYDLLSSSNVVTKNLLVMPD